MSTTWSEASWPALPEHREALELDTSVIRRRTEEVDLEGNIDHRTMSAPLSLREVGSFESYPGLIARVSGRPFIVVPKTGGYMAPPEVMGAVLDLAQGSVHFGATFLAHSPGTRVSTTSLYLPSSRLRVPRLGEL